MGQITENSLMRSLVNAKKVMNKVDNGDYSTGNINPDFLTMGEAEIVNESDLSRSLDTENPRTSTPRPINEESVERINQSKLPDSIKRAMIENPIVQPTLNDTLDMGFLSKAKLMMEKEGLSTPKKSVPTQQNKQSGRSEQSYSSQSININELAAALAPLLEGTIRKTVDEKINQILLTQQGQTINESLMLKVGDNIFSGKITTVKKVKK
jgi:hypothetical protein